MALSIYGLSAENRKKVMLPWLVAVKGISSIHNKSTITRTNIVVMCGHIIELLESDSTSSSNRIGLRIACILANGAVKIFRQQVTQVQMQMMNMFINTMRPPRRTLDPTIKHPKPKAKVPEILGATPDELPQETVVARPEDITLHEEGSLHFERPRESVDYFGSFEGEVMERGAGPTELHDPQLGEIAHSLIEESDLIILGIDTEDIERQMDIGTLLEQDREIVKRKAGALVEDVPPKRPRSLTEIPSEATVPDIEAITQATASEIPREVTVPTAQARTQPRKITAIHFLPKSRHTKALISKSIIQYLKETPIFMRPPTRPYDIFEVLTSENVVEILPFNISQEEQVQSMVPVEDTVITVNPDTVISAEESEMMQVLAVQSMVPVEDTVISVIPDIVIPTEEIEMMQELAVPSAPQETEANGSLPIIPPIMASETNIIDDIDLNMEPEIFVETQPQVCEVVSGGEIDSFISTTAREKQRIVELLKKWDFSKNAPSIEDIAQKPITKLFIALAFNACLNLVAEEVIILQSEEDTLLLKCILKGPKLL